MTSAIVSTDTHNRNEQHVRRHQLHSIAWDPSNPSALLIVSNESSQNDTTKRNKNNDANNENDMNVDMNEIDEINHQHQHIQFHTLYSDTGNVDGILTSYELTALLRLISDYEVRMQQQNQWSRNKTSIICNNDNAHHDDDENVIPMLFPHDSNTQNRTWSYREQSQRYRKVITDLLLDLKINSNDDDDDDDKINSNNKNTKANSEDDPNNAPPMEKQLLHQMNSILYLSEIYLLPPPSSSSITSSGRGNSHVSHHHNNEEEANERTYYYSDGTVRNWFDCPGIATADTIRFLRQCVLLPPPLSSADGQRRKYSDDMMYEVDEEDDVDDYHIFNHADYPNDEAYWEQLLQYCKYGYLHLAWKMLQTHPWYIQSLNLIHSHQNNFYEDSDSGGSSSNANDPISRASAQSIVNEWKQIGSVLLTAPIPGGRCPSFHTGNSDDMNDILPSDHDYDLTSVDGLNVSSTDYQYWDIPTSSSSSNIINHAAINSDRPMIYMPEIAIQKHQFWLDYVKHVRTNNRLCKRLKYFDTMMQLLGGDYGSMKRHRMHSDVVDQRANLNDQHSLFSSWPEQLCCELLYRTPDLRPRSIASRTAVIMQQYHSNNNNAMPRRDQKNRTNRPFSEQSSSSFSAYESSIIAIMQGNAGRTIVELYDFGAGSGAAVPRTLVCFLCRR